MSRAGSTSSGLTDRTKLQVSAFASRLGLRTRIRNLSPIFMMSTPYVLPKGDLPSNTETFPAIRSLFARNVRQSLSVLS